MMIQIGLILKKEIDKFFVEKCQNRIKINVSETEVIHNRHDLNFTDSEG